MRKRNFIIGFALILIISALLTLWWNYGFFSKYNYFSAKRDIKNGNIRLLSYGLPIISSKDKEMEMVRMKYGFKSCNLGCGCTNEDLRTTGIYNKVIEEYLTKRNGKNWQVNFKREIDSLHKIDSAKPN